MRKGHCREGTKNGGRRLGNNRGCRSRLGHGRCASQLSPSRDGAAGAGVQVVPGFALVDADAGVDAEVLDRLATAPGHRHRDHRRGNPLFEGIPRHPGRFDGLEVGDWAAARRRLMSWV